MKLRELLEDAVYKGYHLDSRGGWPTLKEGEIDQKALDWIEAQAICFKFFAPRNRASLASYTPDLESRRFLYSDMFDEELIDERIGMNHVELYFKAAKMNGVTEDQIMSAYEDPTPPLKIATEAMSSICHRSWLEGLAGTSANEAAVQSEQSHIREKFLRDYPECSGELAFRGLGKGRPGNDYFAKMHAGADDYHVGGAYQVLEKHIKSPEEMKKILVAHRDVAAAYRLRREGALMGLLALQEIRSLGYAD
jgi:pyrroloquinoline quinone (PQQ) biosynthesis protein C